MKKLLTVLAVTLFASQAYAAKLIIHNVVYDKAGNGEDLYFFSPKSRFYDSFENKLTIPAATKKNAKLWGKKERQGTLYFARERDLMPKIGNDGTEYIVFYRVPSNSPFLPVPWAGSSKVWIRNLSKVTPKLGMTIKGYRWTKYDKGADKFQKMVPVKFSVDGKDILGDLDEASEIL